MTLATRGRGNRAARIQQTLIRAQGFIPQAALRSSIWSPQPVAGVGPRHTPQVVGYAGDGRVGEAASGMAVDLESLRPSLVSEHAGGAACELPAGSGRAASCGWVSRPGADSAPWGASTDVSGGVGAAVRSHSSPADGLRWKLPGLDRRWCCQGLSSHGAGNRSWGRRSRPRGRQSRRRLPSGLVPRRHPLGSSRVGRQPLSGWQRRDAVAASLSRRVAGVRGSRALTFGDDAGDGHDESALAVRSQAPRQCGRGREREREQSYPKVAEQLLAASSRRLPPAMPASSAGAQKLSRSTPGRRDSATIRRHLADWAKFGPNSVECDQPSATFDQHAASAQHLAVVGRL